jgi:hypothetical protein
VHVGCVLSKAKQGLAELCNNLIGKSRLSPGERRDVNTVGQTYAIYRIEKSQVIVTETDARPPDARTNAQVELIAALRSIAVQRRIIAVFRMMASV